MLFSRHRPPAPPHPAWSRALATAAFFGCLACGGAWLGLTSLDGLLLAVCLLLAFLFVVSGRAALAAIILVFPLASAYAGIYVVTLATSKDLVQRVDRLPFLLPLLAMVLPGFLLRQAGRRGGPPRPDGLLVPAVLLFLYGCITVAWSANTDTTLAQLAILASNVLLYAVVVRETESEQAFKMVLWCLVVTGLLEAFLVVAFYFFKAPKTVFVDYPWFDSIRLYIVSNTGFLDQGVLRRGKALTYPHETGLMMGLYAASAFALALSDRRLRVRIFLGTAIVIFISALFATMCRGPIVATAAMALTYFFLNVRLRRRAFVCLAVLATLCVVTFEAQDALLNYGAGITVTPRIEKLDLYSSNQVRFKWWRRAAEASMETGFLGLGPGGASYLLNIIYGHSLYFSIFFDFGLPGVVLFLWMLSRFLACALPLLRHQDNFLEQAHLLFFVGVVAVSIHMLIDLDYNRPVLWFYLALVVSSGALIRQRRGLGAPASRALPEAAGWTGPEKGLESA
uniref:O-Antigen ligase n=1 Tax=Desulfovibrio sp. U5L TaxID=596152 RepID=I2Q5C4_9BACT